MSFHEARKRIELRRFKVYASTTFVDGIRFEALRGRGRKQGERIVGPICGTPELAMRALLFACQMHDMKKGQLVTS